jgi:cytochrome c
MVMGKMKVAAALAAFVTGGPAFSAQFGDAERGAEVFAECKSCHQVGKGARNRVGPQLNGIFGRQAAVIEGFKYSDSLERMGRDGLVWTLETLDAYIENPKAFATRTRMNYRGLDDAAKRADLLAYLRIYSDNPANIPEAEPTANPHEVDLPPEILALQGDVAFGEYLSSECVTCHQIDGDNEGIPGIIGWPAEDFVIAMHAYKRQLRPHPVMQMMAGRLADEEIAALAAYFESLE